MTDTAPVRYGVYVGYDHHPTDADAAGARRRPACRCRCATARSTTSAARSRCARRWRSPRSPGVTRIETIPILYATNDNATRASCARASPAAAVPERWKDLGHHRQGRRGRASSTPASTTTAGSNAYPGHESLRGKFVGGGNFFAGQPALNTPIDQSENPKHAVDPEVTYHGTHVAGTAIGSGGPERAC